MPEAYEILEARTEEHPVYFDFKKCDFVTHALTMANLSHDPFPNSGLDDFVRRELVCKELVLTCKIKSDQQTPPQAIIDYQGHEFVITRSQPIQEAGAEDSTLFEVEGSCFLSPNEPMKVLARLRDEYARGSR